MGRFSHLSKQADFTQLAAAEVPVFDYISVRIRETSRWQERVLHLYNSKKKRHQP